MVSLGLGGLACKLIHEVGHASTAWALGGRIKGVHLAVPSKPGFFRIDYRPPDGGWRRGLTDLMGAGATTLVAYGLVAALFVQGPPPWVRWAVLPAAVLCAWDMFLYATLPLLGLRRFVVFGGRHAEPVEGALEVGIPRWLLLSSLFLSFVVFHGLVLLVWRQPR